ncbi:MAG: hypothetical protein ASARMPRED_004603 [Alectoria sarmentosa]|nr:MAG: hypothetical protein ASARMPRED_004603 [Alectoria sarmentosa]
MADMQSDHGLRDSNTALLQKLASAVNGHAATATFACGGSVPISDLSIGDFACSAQASVPPVTIRWDSKDSKQSKIAFPLPHHDDVSLRMLDSLLRHCQPATFGVGGRDVLDEEYRKAAKLDTSEFSTNFHPHDCGILDSVEQILLPSTIRGGQGVGIGPQGVRAELYKLNIYSAPSGGALRVKHRGETVDFAWGHTKTSQQAIQWAAFYGDCKHEVLEVTKGHRITLTYNLYYSSIGKLAQPVSDPHHLPLFDIAREMLLEQKFMRKGGILGFFCHHQYAHSQSSGRKSIPGAFKGVDLAIFSVFHALGLKVGVHPIIKNKSENMGGLSAGELMQGPTLPRKGDFVENCLENLSEKVRDRYGDNDDYEFEDDESDDRTIVGTHLHSPTFDENDELESSREPVPACWTHEKVPGIIWMNEPMHKDFAAASLKYGNEASLSYQFSFAAILVIVPPSRKRGFTPTNRRASHPKVDIPPTTSPDTVIATPTSSMNMTPSRAMGGVASTSASRSAFNTVSSSSWGADSNAPISVHQNIADEWSLGPEPGLEWDSLVHRENPVEQPGSAVHVSPLGSQHQYEWISAGTEYGDGAPYVSFEGRLQ